MFDHHTLTSRLRMFAIVVFAVLALLLSGCGILDEARPDAPETSADSTEDVPADSDADSNSTDDDSNEKTVQTKLLRIIDGDTIAVAPVEGVLPGTNAAGDEHSVRMLGIDTPEMNFHDPADPECGAEEATEHLEELLPVDHDVILTFDEKADHTDRYDRSLAYVANLGLDDINLAMVADGYAEPWYPKSAPEPTRVPEYTKAAEKAEADNLGSYAECSDIGRD